MFGVINMNFTIEKCFCGSPINEEISGDGVYRCSTCNSGTLWLRYGKGNKISYLGYLINNEGDYCSDNLIKMEIHINEVYILTCPKYNIDEKYKNVLECYTRMKSIIDNSCLE